MTSEGTPIADSGTLVGSTGFDAPITSLEADYLNRWPLARQVYRVAVDGPAEWSARIGVYGEWGTGKTSVLRFVEAMARKDGHIVAWFDPWEYGNKSDLWQAFVLAVSNAAEAKLGNPVEVGGKKLKAASGKVAGFLSKLSKAVPLEGASAVGEGLELLRSAFAFSQKDLDGLLEVLNGNRVIVIIDDLDRTEAELVPEILFALKQVMDVRGFSFICGFDPQVVGKVLKSRHKGFGNGLKFLEKIIDYPVWLPPASSEGLKKIAEADAEKYCPFIPPSALHDALDLLPKNPRSIRQFVRLCALLKTQTERHGSDELNWPIILMANVIKVRFPMLDPRLLHSQEFYGGIGMRRTYNTSAQEGEKVDQEIAAHAEKCLTEIGIIDASGESMNWLQRAIRRICQHLDLWMGEGVQGVIYQATLVEWPRALTKQEFDEVTPLWKSKKSIPSVGRWIADHAEKQGLRITEVAGDLVILLVDRLKNCLRAADGAFTDREKVSNRAQAKRIQSFLEELVLRPAKFHADLHARDWIPVDLLISEMVKLAEARSPVHQELWPKNERILVELVGGWDARFEPLLDAARSVGRHGRHCVEGRFSTAIARQLNDIVDDHLSYQLIKGIDEADFIARIAYHRDGTKVMRELIVNPQSRLWMIHSGDFVAAFAKRRPTAGVRGNAYMLLEWIKHLLKDVDPGDGKTGQAMAGNNDLMQAVWQAATFKPFLGSHAHMIREIPEKAKELGVALEVPSWWQPAIDEYLRSLEHEPKAKEDAPVASQESNDPEA
jgi:hypothetical protein